MFELHNLTSSGKDRKRVGRGGKLGGTSGKGHKGQKARSGGYVRPGFEGGQMPLYRRLPKRGFTNAPFKVEVKTVNLRVLENHFDNGQEITRELLIQKKIIKPGKTRSGICVKVLGDGTLTKKFVVVANMFSQSAMEAINKAGGEARISQEG